MQQYFIDTIWMVPVYPLIAALFIILGRGVCTGPAKQPLMSNKSWAMALTVGATALGLCHAVAAIFWLLAQKPDEIAAIEHNVPWLTAGDFTLSVGYLVDSMSVMMLTVVTFISLFIQIYTHGYMRHDDGYAKFYSYLALFNFSMLGLVLSTNLFQIYIFWELVGVCSYLLIGFWFKKPAAGAASIKAFLMNRVGDFGFLIGILCLLFITWSFWPAFTQQFPSQVVLGFQSLPAAVHYIQMTIGGDGAAFLLALTTILLFMGPMAKSAQVPLHTWLPDAMEGPTPISALIHAATMVAAGVYLVGRIYPLVAASEMAMGFITLIGVLTAVIGATIALTQTDIKKALAYSTMSQLGFMVTGMGVGAFSAALFHLFTHAFFKAMLFLCSGSVIHACEDEQDMRKMGGLWKKLPVTAWTYLIGCFAISGLAYTSGFWSKDEILVGAQNYSQLVFTILSVTAGLTAFYMFRTFFMTFTGAYRGEAHVHHEDKVMTVPLMVLAVPSLLIGFMLSGAGGSLLTWAQWITPLGVHVSEHGHHAPSFTSPIAIQSQVVGAVGLVLAFLFYGKVRILDADLVRKIFYPLYVLFSRKWYFDEFYGSLVRNGVMAVSRLSAFIDRTYIDGLVNLTGRSVYGSGQILRVLHSGKVQTYVAVLFFSVFVLSLLLVYWMV